MSDTTPEAQELREKLGNIKIARDNRTMLFHTLAGHSQFEEIMALITADKEKAVREARIDELLQLKSCRNVADEQLVNMGTEVWIDDRLSELQSHQEKEKE